MRIKFKVALMLPLLLGAVGCSKQDKISFQSCGFTFDTYYNDSYFLLDNANPHEEIALASHAMALATFNGDEDYSTRSRFIRKLWSDEHFDNIYFSDSFYIKPGSDSIAYGIASKKINDFTLLAIAVRGGNYDGEWASNLTLGLEGNAQGFDEASNMVIQGISYYVNHYDIEGHVKFWIAGYSRAAITTNMTAGKLLNNLEEGIRVSSKVSYTADDFYAYCFEPPMGVVTSIEDARKELYHGIHNYVNYNDFVPLVAPYEWGFVRYGTDHYYPDRLNDIFFDASEREKIITLYHFSYGAQDFAKYSVDDWKFFDIGERAIANNLPRESINPSQGRFLHSFIHELALTGIQSREDYYGLVQDGVREIMKAIMGLNPNIDKINTANLIPMIFEYDFIRTLIMELEEDQPTQFAMDAEMLFLQLFGANENNFEYVEDLYTSNFALLTFFANSFRTRKDIMAQLLYRDNAMGIAIGHMPELSYSMLCACDTRFMGDKACKLNDGTYNVLHIEEPSNFTLIEKSLKKEVFRYKDGVMTSDCLSAEKLANGAISVYLPKNGSYEYISDSVGIFLNEQDPVKGLIETNKILPATGSID